MLASCGIACYLCTLRGRLQCPGPRIIISTRIPGNMSDPSRIAAWYKDGVYPALDRHRKLVALSAYGAIALAAYAFAVLLRFEFAWPQAFTGVFAASAGLLVAIRVALASLFRLSTGRWRYVSTDDVARLFASTTAGTFVFFVVTRLVPYLVAVPRSVIAVEWVLTTFMTAGLWLGYRLTFEKLRLRLAVTAANPKRVLVLGAGEAGRMLVHEMRRFPTGYQPVGFVDDDAMKWGTTLHGVSVIGGIHDVPSIARAAEADELIIAIPSATPEEFRRIVELCEETELGFKTLPGIAEVLDGGAHLYQLRDVRLEDLLGRDPIELELPELAEELRRKSVLVTGAAGSIGSELSRQIALHHPGCLILLDQSETPLVDLDRELSDRFPGMEKFAVVGDVADEATMERVFETHEPDQVFHAAAYKHVPIMEENASEAIRNNVVGTWRVAEAAGRYGAAKFVLVSTDKAVRPANVMGATKRLAERVVLQCQERFPETSYAAVRFGNVLGSNGSVIPLFRRQLAAGQPLTVTHPDVTRYFMTIPEAVQLILQASLLPDLRGHIAMLDMGDPVRVVDLARNLLRLSGNARRIGRDIVFTGLRPGEKLHEELIAPDEIATETAIPQVRLLVNPSSDRHLGPDMAEQWSEWLGNGGAHRVLDEFAQLFPGLKLNTEQMPTGTAVL